jgi:cysteine desulfurase
LLVEDARQSLGLLIGCRAQDVVFTSGGTEANNLALSGFSHVITSAIEHDSVLQAAPQASLLPVTDDGLVDLAALKQMVAALPADQRDQTIVSVMAANNETGVIQPLAGIASFSAHKIGGPTGVGALVVRPGMRLTSLLRGGGQEQGRRSGTENILGITGFGAAATAAFGDVAHFRDMAGWRDAFEAEVAAARPDVALFGAAAPRLGNTSCLAVGGKSSETLVMALDIAGVAVSAGSACSSGKVTASHVLTAMRAGEKAAQAIRVSGGWQTRKEDFERLAQVLAGL